MKSLRLEIHQSGYVIGKKQMRTVGALEAELIRLCAKEARVTPGGDASYRKVAAALRVLQKLGIPVGMAGSVQSQSRSIGT